MPDLVRAPRPHHREREILSAIFLAVNGDPDVVVWRNAIDDSPRFDARSGRPYHAHTGLTVGSADLVGLLRPGGRFFALEVKRPGQKERPEQLLWAELVRRLGGFVATVRSVDEALAALERARKGAAA